MGIENSQNMKFYTLTIFCHNFISTINSHGSHSHEHSPLEVDGHLHHKDVIDKFAQEMAGKGIKNMNHAQLQFYYYKSHDFDFDDKLDGIELIQKMIREKKIEAEENGEWGENPTDSKSDEDWAVMVDKVLEQ